MLFNSHIFIFLPITLIGFYWIGGISHQRVALSWLVAVNLSQMQDKNGMHKAKCILVAGIAVNLGLIGYL